MRLLATHLHISAHIEPALCLDEVCESELHRLVDALSGHRHHHSITGNAMPELATLHPTICQGCACTAMKQSTAQSNSDKSFSYGYSERTVILSELQQACGKDFCQ